ncbi:hypothetical protein [Mycobacterium haemophilum]|uniref:Uncharacterized protein n=1 Tax=Mycobacterium haemophilum TaxID=29311 RepID=A0A0I9UAV9_9MYCO|nr:hypothetical protein [Mycobacterium haemophilum]KLO29896.1 hypothetical protein ABH39_11340 [Mycobacterium haemophilum]KLO38478.1 hypothetical protein ABH38_03490 [Mycobacterium haemophilum]KLO44812.1 hypothetical protein ABH37_02380 [Mycobacterium haemophilum]KLO56155.1 hypothetical protein ABH36_02365 [Mycobacterium haemophilum]
MAGEINLSDARVQLDSAKDHYSALLRIFAEWTKSGGIHVETVRDPVFVEYRWQVVVGSEPSRNLPALAGHIVGDLWTTLGYIAFAIYRAAGGAPDGDQAAVVAFPILKDRPKDWSAVVKNKVPGIWPAASKALKVSQPFAQKGQEALALPTIQALGRTDKHRNLNLCAAMALSGNAIGPQTGTLPAGLEIRLARADGNISQGPVVPIEPGTTVQLGLCRVPPSLAPFEDAMYTWASGIRFDQPPPPHVEFSFRANNSVEASIEGFGGLIQHVEGIVDRISALAA